MKTKLLRIVAKWRREIRKFMIVLGNPVHQERKNNKNNQVKYGELYFVISTHPSSLILHPFFVSGN